MQTYYERLAGITDADSAELGLQTEHSGSSKAEALAAQPPASATTAARKAKPPLPKGRRSTPAEQQEQRAPQDIGAQTPSRGTAIALAAVTAGVKSSAAPRSIEQSCVSAAPADRHQQPAVSLKQQGRAEAKLRARVEELQVLLCLDS